eukprot:12202788-Heterocapsa_arctica.AAC.1
MRADMQRVCLSSLPVADLAPLDRGPAYAWTAVPQGLRPIPLWPNSWAHCPGLPCAKLTRCLPPCPAPY